MGKLQDLTGKHFGLLIVLKRTEDTIYKNKKRYTTWTCKCDCGKTKAFTGHVLRGEQIISCGCDAKKNRLQKIIGKRFGKLIVVNRTPNKNNCSFLNCKCDCGGKVIVRASSLYRGATKSCGCLRRLAPGQAIKNALFSLAKIHAKNPRRGKSKKFDLSFDEFVKISESNCTYCGAKPRKVTQTGKYGAWYANGIDRIDSTKGYIIGNCVPCCKFCNIAKNDRSVSAFLEHIMRISLHQSIQTGLILYS